MTHRRAASRKGSFGGGDVDVSGRFGDFALRAVRRAEPLSTSALINCAVRAGPGEGGQIHTFRSAPAMRAAAGHKEPFPVAVLWVENRFVALPVSLRRCSPRP